MRGKMSVCVCADRKWSQKQNNNINNAANGNNKSHFNDDAENEIKSNRTKNIHKMAQYCGSASHNCNC